VGPNGGLLLIGMGPSLSNTEADSNENHRALALVTKHNDTERLDFGGLKPGEPKTVSGPLEWAAVKSKYFVTGAGEVDAYVVRADQEDGTALNFAVLAILVVHGRRLVVALAEHSSIATMGRASLTVFSAHLVLCLVLLAMGGDTLDPGHVSLLDGALLAGTLVTLYVIARVTLGGSRILAKLTSAARPKAAADVNARAAR